MIDVKKQVEESQQDRVVIGNVVSNAMDKTAVVTVERRVAHKFYGKIIKRTTKYYVHDPENKLLVGDVVKIKQSRPISKLKRWVIQEVINTQQA